MDEQTKIEKKMKEKKREIKVLKRERQKDRDKERKQPRKFCLRPLFLEVQVKRENGGRKRNSVCVRERKRDSFV